MTIATFSSVIVSLWIALRSTRPKLKIKITYDIIFNNIECEKAIDIHITNIGKMKTTINSFSILRSDKKIITFMPYLIDLPKSIEPMESFSIYIVKKLLSNLKLEDMELIPLHTVFEIKDNLKTYKKKMKRNKKSIFVFLGLVK